MADGFEEVEALATVDVLRRGGMNVKTVSIKESKEVTGANGVTIIADESIQAIDPKADYEWVICPGGMPGASNLHDSKMATELLEAQYKRKGKVAAICASPAVVLSPLGFLDHRKATCYPGMESLMNEKVDVTGQPVVKDGNIVTGRGPGFTFDFALAILAESKGKDTADKVAQGMLLRD